MEWVSRGSSDAGGRLTRPAARPAAAPRRPAGPPTSWRAPRRPEAAAAGRGRPLLHGGRRPPPAQRRRADEPRLRLGAKAGALDDAVAAYEALRLRPDFALAHLNLGNALQRQGHFDRAVPSFRESIRLDPTDPLGPLQPGQRPVPRSDRPARRSRPTARRSASTRTSPRPTRNLGIALAGRRRPGRGHRRLPRGPRHQPERRHRRTTTSAAPCSTRGSSTRRSAAAYGEAARVKPDYAMAHCNLGSALSSKGTSPDAAGRPAAGARIRQKDPGWSRAVRRLGRAMRAADRAETPGCRPCWQVRTAPADGERRRVRGPLL